MSFRAALARVDLAPGGELTSNVYPSSQYPGELDVLYVTTKTGAVALTVDSRRRREGVPLCDGPGQLRCRVEAKNETVD